ncbi:hypothetical protein FSS13T_27180 [Flavobacterium saliperosum S13]|uniref:DUF4145 domain-containing protein n=2 Tax=Flavobacterium saliperosum TaxID=329186 RepID=A0A1G4WA95_9FLAO|nr:DUF4145 domain-containing protein [Flavobacterium saliperosum]ESU21373.1 hypothetical protein FSS13T_27180 [Flavobacterium saliperosum S13]SCX19304.1 protein of unknown function [Flavobacterium saliperosum]
MNRELWSRKYFNHDNPSNYPCPFCNTGVLTLKERILSITPYGKDMEYYNYNNGIDHLFSGILICKNAECNEIVIISGSCLRDIVIGDEQPDGGYLERRISTYYPKFFFPNLKLFPINKTIPKEVKEQINFAFSHYFNDLSSSANRIRNAIELILDDLKAPKSRKTKAGKKQTFKTLHSRIEHFSKKNVKISKLLLALKIIGNEGSHVGNVQNEDILNAFEILEMLLEFTYQKQHQRILKMATEIIDKAK